MLNYLNASAVRGGAAGAPFPVLVNLLKIGVRQPAASYLVRENSAFDKDDAAPSIRLKTRNWWHA
jgi:hypothetical protein